MISQDMITAKKGFPFLENLTIGSKNEPKILSLAKASKTREAPIRLLSAAKKVAANIPRATKAGM